MTASLRDVLPAAGAALGVPGATDRIGLELDRAPRRVVVLLVDGLGYHLLPELAADAPLLAEVLHGRAGRLRRLECVFPSTTPTNLVSLGTGAWPGEHGILGFTVRIPGTARLLTHIRWGIDPSPASWQPVPTWFERIAAHCPASVVLPAMFGGSGLTVAAYRGARFVGVGPKEDYEALLLDVARAGPGLVFGYTAALDTAAHLYGIASPEWHQAARNVDQLIARLAAGLPADALLLVTADHGGLDVAPDARFDVDTDPRLAAGVGLVAGEPRVRFLHTVPGASADVIAAWSEVLGADAVVAGRDDIVARGVFGPVPPQHLGRIGDVVVVCTGPIAVMASVREDPLLAKLMALHGAWTPVETAIPLIAFGPSG